MMLDRRHSMSTFCYRMIFLTTAAKITINFMFIIGQSKCTCKVIKNVLACSVALYLVYMFSWHFQYKMHFVDIVENAVFKSFDDIC